MYRSVCSGWCVVRIVWLLLLMMVTWRWWAVDRVWWHQWGGCSWTSFVTIITLIAIQSIFSMNLKINKLTLILIMILENLIHYLIILNHSEINLTFMCFLRLDGWVYDLSQPLTLQLYGLSDVCTWLCFFLSLELAKRRSHPSNSHLKGFSPEKLNKKTLIIDIQLIILYYDEYNNLIIKWNVLSIM